MPNANNVNIIIELKFIEIQYRKSEQSIHGELLVLIMQQKDNIVVVGHKTILKRRRFIIKFLEINVVRENTTTIMRRGNQPNTERNY